jgi:hypothetical protein
MPLIRIDAIEGRSKERVRGVLDGAHRAMLAAFKVPPRDRYQIYHEHPAAHVVAEDSGLGIERTRNLLIFAVISRPRSEQKKLAFYKALCAELKSSCGIELGDVIVSVGTNSDADWSFGSGRAQFITWRALKRRATAVRHSCLFVRGAPR